MPILLMWGAHDAVIPIKHAHLAQAAMPGSRLEVYPEAGHFPHHADPERFVADLERFIATSDPATYDRSHWRAVLRGATTAESNLIDLDSDAFFVE